MKPWKDKNKTVIYWASRDVTWNLAWFQKTVFNLCCCSVESTSTIIWHSRYNHHTTQLIWHENLGKKGDMYTIKHLRMVRNIDIQIPWRPLYNDWYVLSLQIFTITTLSAYIGFNRQKVIQKLETLFLRIYSISTLADPQLGNKNKRNVSKTNFSSVFTQYV